MQIRPSGTTFEYDSSLWTNYNTLNAEHTTEVENVDVKLPLFYGYHNGHSSVLNGLQICVDVTTNCYT